jgi:hypothetical protein
VGEHYPFVREHCPVVGEHSLLGVHPHAYRATPPPFSRHRDALVAVRIGPREVRRVLGLLPALKSQLPPSGTVGQWDRGDLEQSPPRPARLRARRRNTDDRPLRSLPLSHCPTVPLSHCPTVPLGGS